jgi:hypothetical protein
MQGRKCFVFLTLTLLISGCSPNSIMKPDCHSCTVEEQEWDEFAWTFLEGKWKGSVENLRNVRDNAKKAKTDKYAELNFMKADKVGTCAGLPENSLVLNGLLWEGRDNGKELEAFVPAEDGKVAYGRISFTKMNGRDFCQFRRLGRVMGKNRLNLPTVSFSERANPAGRAPASTAPEQEISLEFLRFAHLDKKTAFQGDGRKPSSVKEQERPSLILRVFKISTDKAAKRSEWAGTEEYIYRLWKAQ